MEVAKRKKARREEKCRAVYFPRVKNTKARIVLLGITIIINIYKPTSFL